MFAREVLVCIDPNPIPPLCLPSLVVFCVSRHLSLSLVQQSSMSTSASGQVMYLVTARTPDDGSKPSRRNRRSTAETSYYAQFVSTP